MILNIPLIRNFAVMKAVEVSLRAQHGLRTQGFIIFLHAHRNTVTESPTGNIQETEGDPAIRQPFSSIHTSIL